LRFSDSRLRFKDSTTHD